MHSTQLHISAIVSSAPQPGEEEGYFTPPLLTGVSESPGELKSSKEEMPLVVKGEMDQSAEQRAAVVQVKVDFTVDKVQCMKDCKRGV